MLQQTRVAAVIPYYTRWMSSFPTLSSLSSASPTSLNQHWQGLGFYRRCALLLSGAKHVTSGLSGVLPTTVVGLKNIPGIGPYTAGAIASIAMGMQVPVVDGNVLRALSRLTGVCRDVKSAIYKDKFGWTLAKELVDGGEEGGVTASDVNQSAMEVGATFCASAGTGVDVLDPLKEFYISTKLGAEAFDYLTGRDEEGAGGRGTIKLDEATAWQGDGDCDVAKAAEVFDAAVALPASTASLLPSSSSSTVVVVNPSRLATLRLLASRCRCDVCNEGGTSAWLAGVVDAIETGKTRDDCRVASHGMLPAKPEKKRTRDERVQVGVVARRRRRGGGGGEGGNDGDDEEGEGERGEGDEERGGEEEGKMRRVSDLSL
jgi:A/G-specific adenine glycosylase